MKNFIVLMSHDMSDTQKNDAYENLEVTKIIEAPPKQKNLGQYRSNIRFGYKKSR